MQARICDLKRIDWPEILADLLRAGLSLPAISRELRIGVGTPYWWMQGSEPLYSHGAALIELHRERTAGRPWLLARAFRTGAFMTDRGGRPGPEGAENAPAVARPPG